MTTYRIIIIRNNNLSPYAKAVIGFYPYKYLKLFFPIIILILMPIRHKIIPKIVPERYIHAMDIA